MDHSRFIWRLCYVVPFRFNAREGVLQGHPPVHIADCDFNLPLVPESSPISSLSIPRLVQLAWKNHPGDLFIPDSHLYDRQCRKTADLHPSIPHAKLHVSYNDLYRGVLRPFSPDAVF